MLPWKLRKRQFLPVHQNLSSVHFSLAKFQLVSSNLSLAMIWQMTHNHKLPKLCSATLTWIKYYNRELKQQQRRRLRKRHLKSEFVLLQTLQRVFHLVQFVKCCRIFLELNSKRVYQNSEKGKESRCLVFRSSTKREIRQSHVVVVQRRQRKVQ